MDFLSLFKHLLPRARAWRITIEKTLRSFFEGLSGLPANVKTFFDGVYLDLFPATTRVLGEWETAAALPPTVADEQARRDRLAAFWQAQGGQDPRYIQDTLRAAGFDVYVHEAWTPASSWPNGPAVYRNPNNYLTGGSLAFKFLMQDGGGDAQDGDPVAQDGQTSSPVGYPLVNKVVLQAFIMDGAESMQDGDPDAQDGDGFATFLPKTYPLPSDPALYPYFFYIGGETFPDQASVPNNRRDEFEDLCLKICPTQLWLGILVNYT